MKIVAWFLLLLLLAAVVFHAHNGGNATMAVETAAAEPLLVHNVYFQLNESNPEAIAKLVASCKKYLTDHPGTVLFACGTVSDLDRSVNDREWDVGLHLVFKNRAAHDQYQTAPRHLQFIEENKATWKKVRVFDSDCQPVAK
jgi:hypothetical protein